VLSSINHFLKKVTLTLLKTLIGRKPLDPQAFQADSCKRILVIRQHDYLGDFLLSLPVLRALRLRFPCAHIGLVAREYFAKTVSHNSEFDELLVYRRKWDLDSFRRFLGQLRSQWDLCIVLNTISHSLTSDLLAWGSGAPVILGAPSEAEDDLPRLFLYNLRSEVLPGLRHETLRNLDIVKVLGAEADNLSPRVAVSDAEKNRAQEILVQLGRKAEKPRLVGLHLGAGKPENRWPLERFAALAARLHEEGQAQVAVTWGLDEEPLAKQFLESADIPCLRGGAPPLRDLAALFAEYDALICNDTGMLHLGAAVGTPLVAIFGPTDPERFLPIGEHNLAVKAADSRVDSVTVEQVWEALGKLPKRRPRPM